MYYSIREEDVYIQADSSTEEGRIEIGEDETILDSEYRGANRMVVAVASPITDSRCQWVTDAGTQCSRDTEDGDEYCWQHPPDTQ